MIEQIDAIIGMNLRLARERRGLSQTVLAGTLGITFQQLQKYENGANRLSAGRMYHACRALGVSCAEIFQGLDALPASVPERSMHPQSTQAYRIVNAMDDAERRLTAIRVLRALAA